MTASSAAADRAGPVASCARVTVSPAIASTTSVRRLGVHSRRHRRSLPRGLRADSGRVFASVGTPVVLSAAMANGNSVRAALVRAKRGGWADRGLPEVGPDGRLQLFEHRDGTLQCSQGLGQLPCRAIRVGSSARSPHLASARSWRCCSCGGCQAATSPSRKSSVSTPAERDDGLVSRRVALELRHSIRGDSFAERLARERDRDGDGARSDGLRRTTPKALAGTA